MNRKEKCENTIDISRLKALIDTKTREEIAKNIGCDTSLITKHYNEARTVTIDYLKKYATFFNVSTDYLLGLTNASAIADTDEEKTIRTVCDYTGLDEKAALILNNENSTSPNFSNVVSDFIINSNVIYLIIVYVQQITAETSSIIHFKEEMYARLESIKNAKDIDFREKLDLLNEFGDSSRRRLSYFEADEEFKRFLRNYTKFPEYKELEEFEKKASDALNELMRQYNGTN